MKRPWDIEGQGSYWGINRASKTWQTLAGTKAPMTLREAESRLSELQIPPEITVKLSGKYWNVIRWQ